jgi:integrase
MIAVFRATGMRLSELAGIRYDPGDPRRSDLDLWHGEITVHGKGRKTRTVKISRDAARALDWYLRLRIRRAQGYRPQQMSKSPSRPFPVTVTQLPVTRCEICRRTVAYRPGSLSEALTEYYRRAYPEALGVPSR